MSDELSFAEVDGQSAELLPARTVLSMFIAGGAPADPASGAAGGGAAGGGAAYTAGEGGDGSGKAAFFHPIFIVKEGDVTNALTGGAGGTGGAVGGGGGAAPAGTGAAGG
ncbi:MAG: hypothetical protein ACRDRA_05140 [Pseudonocardiaceae bacterium]